MGPFRHLDGGASRSTAIGHSASQIFGSKITAPLDPGSSLWVRPRHVAFDSAPGLSSVVCNGRGRGRGREDGGNGERRHWRRDAKDDAPDDDRIWTLGSWWRNGIRRRRTKQTLRLARINDDFPSEYVQCLGGICSSLQRRLRSAAYDTHASPSLLLLPSPSA